MAILAENGSIWQHTGQVVHHSKKCHSRDLQEMQNCPCESGIQDGMRSPGPIKWNESSNIISFSPNTSPKDIIFFLNGNQRGLFKREEIVTCKPQYKKSRFVWILRSLSPRAPARLSSFLGDYPTPTGK